MQKQLLLFIFLIISRIVFAQENAIPQTVSVFLDCDNGGGCSSAFIRQELQQLNFVRDRLDADVHVMKISQWNESGSTKVTLYFIGRNAFVNKQDTLSYTIPPASQEAESRVLEVENLKIGLFPYLIKTKQLNNISLVYNNEESKEASIMEKDKWNYWVFQLGLNGNMSGNKNYFDGSASGYASANRETYKSKSNFYLNNSQSLQTYFDGQEKYKYKFQTTNFGCSYLKKLNEHVAVGASSGFYNSLFSNYKSKITVTPRIEYSIFPYKDFNLKRFIFFYELGPALNNYYDSTIFLKRKENLFQQNIGTIASFTQPWGSINIGSFWSNYMHNFALNNLSFNGAVSMRLAKGLNFAVWGDYNFVHDQISIRKGDASLDQLLVQNRELLSSYSFNLGMGISYRFGSKNNSMVFPAFRGLNYSINF